MRSRFAILATFLVVALVFAGCVAPVAVPAKSGGEAAAAGGEAASDAAPTELVVSTWGFNQDLIDKNLTRPFEEANNVKIVYETGNNAERLTKLAARGDSPQVDVVHFAGPFTFEASQQGLLQPIDPSMLSNYDELYDWAKKLQAPHGLIEEIAETGKLPVPLFCAGGLATPADASLVMQLGAEAVFVGSGIFKSDDPARRAKAIVEATTHYDDPAIIAKVSTGLGSAMPGLEIGKLETRFDERGW